MKRMEPFLRGRLAILWSNCRYFCLAGLPLTVFGSLASLALTITSSQAFFAGREVTAKLCELTELFAGEAESPRCVVGSSGGARRLAGLRAGAAPGIWGGELGARWGGERWGSEARVLNSPPLMLFTI